MNEMIQMNLNLRLKQMNKDFFLNQYFFEDKKGKVTNQIEKN